IVSILDIKKTAYAVFFCLRHAAGRLFACGTPQGGCIFACGTPQGGCIFACGTPQGGCIFACGTPQVCKGIIAFFLFSGNSLYVAEASPIQPRKDLLEILFL
ncbi:hypothetical protein SM386_23580, partial [Salmonella enterica]|nr:hypothetical protein [Salmonella enterica]